MSLNISERFLRIAKPVNIDIDITKLGKIQSKKLVKALRTRVIVAGGIPNSIAYAYLRKNDSSYFMVGRSSFSWRNIDRDEWAELQPKIEAVAVDASLDAKVQEEMKEYAKYGWAKDSLSPLQELIDGLNNKKDQENVSWGAGGICDILKMHLDKLSPIKEIEEVANRIESGELTTLSVSAEYLY